MRAVAQSIGSVLKQSPLFALSEQAASARMIPDLTRLQALYDLSRFTPLACGLKKHSELRSMAQRLLAASGAKNARHISSR
jgi:hypothetical protein